MRGNPRRALVRAILGASLVASAYSGVSGQGHKELSFREVLDARYQPGGARAFDALRESVETVSPSEIARSYVRVVDPLTGVAKMIERIPCKRADSNGLLRSMIIVAQEHSRGQSERGWAKVQRAYQRARNLERLYVARARKTSSFTPLGLELALRAARDQAWRAAQYSGHYDESVNEAITWRFRGNQCHIDHDNAAFVASLVDGGRWPTISQDGKVAANNAWLLAQHADADRVLQRKVLSLLEPLVAAGEASGSDFALLFDRVSLADGRPQRFATQFGKTSGGCLAAEKTEEPKTIDRRRAGVGLMPIAIYAKKLSKSYHARVCADVFSF